MQLDKPEIPEGFTLALALVDAVPVLLFCGAAVLFGTKIESLPFFLGAILAFMGGAGKVAWKLTIALARKNVTWLGRQMRITMPIGFLLMLLGCALCGNATIRVVTSLGKMPSIAFMLIWLICMCAMSYFAMHRDQTNARDNWTEQLTNAVGQGALLLAILFI